mmetsp:Transcript_26030/g.57261  ORF Transcript_26030/g.57261 Transcript_26030/m.57261 type:complete len:290 (-) Transcript_26030:63-932(-)
MFTEWKCAVPPALWRCLSLSLLLAWCPRCAAKYGNYHEFDSEYPHRMPLSKKCGDFECPAFQRPVQKYEADFKIWAWTECPVQPAVNQHVGEAVAARRLQMQKNLTACCQVKYVCMHTCGMKLQDCYRTFWECAERTCYRDYKDENQECLSTASWNDIRHLPDVENGELPVMGMYGENVCQAFNQLQRTSCDCVPHAEWEGLLQKRMEAFFTTYDPSQLTKKGKVKEKVWKNWRNKRPMMMFAFTMKFKQDAVEHRRNESAHLEEENPEEPTEDDPGEPRTSPEADGEL